MCGIAGIVGDTPKEKLLRAAQDMAAAMRHRGPDSCGVISSGECLLVNTRLAILDLSEHGRQPMTNSARTVWITYNGETYNAAALRRDLLEKGYSFHSATDTEVILRLYEEYGEACTERMRGMFAFAIWDARTSKLLLARDRLGIKPLYFARQKGRLLFASELKCLLASGLIEPRIDPQGLHFYLQLGHIPPPRTMIDGIVALPPGHMAVRQDGAWTLRAYWNLDGRRESSDEPAPADLAGLLGDALLEAMQGHLISDVPVALFLSGGVDSACLAALAHHAQTNHVTAITLGFPEREFDETALSRQTARVLGLPFRHALLSPQEVIQELDPCIWAMDQPSVDGLNSYWISKIAAGQGFKVALSGQGGDELFGGYTSWKWFERFESLAAWTGLLPSGFGRLFDRERWPYRWRKLSYLFGDGDPFLASQMAVKILFLESDINRMLVPSFAESRVPGQALACLRDAVARFEKKEHREKLALMDISTHLQPRLLRDLDAMSMAHSLEVRPVFLDDELVELVLGMPAALLARPKELLLQAMKRFLPGDLLADLRSRSKRTFTFPFAKWFAHDLKPALSEAFSPLRLREQGILEPYAVARLWERFQRAPQAVGWSRIWNLFVLTRWCEALKVHP
jgi:asparagine synthase (glutamine-hydrolysing)